MGEPEHDDPPPRHPTLPLGYAPITPQPAHLDERSRVSLRLWQLAAGAAALVSASITGWSVYQGIQTNISGLRADVSALRGDLANPARINDACRAVLQHELSKPMVVECPKRIVKGEAVTRCVVVMPKSEP